MLFDLLVRHRRFVYLAIAGMCAAGLWAAVTLPSSIYPELTFPRITVLAKGTSLGARQIAFDVTRPLEEAVSVVPGVSKVRTYSLRSVSEVAIYFEPSTDMAYALQMVQARVNEVRGQLPAGLDFEVERLTPALFPILSYNVEGGDPATLNDVARYQIKPVLARVPGVARVNLLASATREIEVVADPARLAALGMTYADLATAIKEGLAVQAVGRVAKNYKQLLVVTDQEAHTPQDVANVVIRPGLRVGDVATVSLGTEDPVAFIAGDGRPAALLTVARQIGGNTLVIADSIDRTIKSLRLTLPPGVRITPLYDQAALVRESVASVRDAMIVGALLAVVILLAFLRHGRITAVSAAAIPLTLALTVFVMQLFGQTFNLMSLGAMAIAIGLVIDDAVVVVENIARHLSFTADRHQALRDAVQEIIWPVTTSTITTVVVFLPLGLLEGVAGQFFKTLSITLTIAVLVSLVVAFSIIPLFANEFVTGHDEAAGGNPARRGGLLHRLLAGVANQLDMLSDRYERSLGALLVHPGRVAIAGGLLLLAGGIAWRFVGTGFLPSSDEGAFVLDYFAPGGTELAETDRQVRIVESVLATTPEVAGTSRRLGARLGFAASQQNRGDIVVRLKPRSQRSRHIDDVMEDLRGQLALRVPRLRIEMTQILSDLINDLEGAPKPIELKIFGEKLETSEAYAEKLSPKLQQIPGLVDFFNGVVERNTDLMLRIDGAEAARIGLTAEDVARTVSGAQLGADAGVVRGDDRTISIRARAPDSTRFNATTLAGLPVTRAGGGQPTPLGGIASFREVESRTEYQRENQRLMLAMTAGVEGTSLGHVIREVQRVLVQNPPPPGVQVELGGQYEAQQRAFRALLTVLLLAAFCVVAVMVLQFESFVEPLVIVLAAPVSFVGALAMLIITSVPLNVSSFMGLILLVGLVVKNGIILLDFTRRLMSDGNVPLEDAIRQAARTRLRPILMTTLCTLFGLLPLALGIGAGAELQRPLALAVVGGLTLSTPVTLYMVPVIVAAIRRRMAEKEAVDTEAVPA